jgi:hypothetical protein
MLLNSKKLTAKHAMCWIHEGRAFACPEIPLVNVA